MTIYIDLFFIINFVQDFIILSLALISCRVRFLRRAGAAMFGAAYACIAVISGADVLFGFFAKACVLMIMCAICLVPCRLKHYITKLFSAFLISVFFCGVIYTTQIFFGRDNLGNISDLFLGMGICAGYFTLRFGLSFIKSRSLNEHYKIEVYYNDRHIVLKGICDNGNMLTEPITKYPVIIADFEAVKRVFPEISSPYQLCELVEPKDFRQIPYKTISDKGIAYGFIPKKIIIDGKVTANAVIAIAPVRLEEDILISPALI